MLSERSIVKVCSEINAYQGDVIDDCNEFRGSWFCKNEIRDGGESWSCKNKIRDGIWKVYIDRVGW